MKYINSFNILEDIEDNLQEIFDKYHIIKTYSIGEDDYR